MSIAHGLDLSPRRFQALPKWLQRVTSTAISHEHDRSGAEVQHGRQKPFPADAYLVDRDFPEVPEFRPRVMPFEMPLLDFLDRIPTDLQVPGHALHGHVLRQFQHVTLEAACMAPVLVGKPDFHLACDPAPFTENPGDVEHNLNWPASNGQQAESARDFPAALDVRSAAPRTPQPVSGLGNYERHRSVLVERPFILVAPNPETVVDYAGGHAVSPVKKLFRINSLQDQLVR
jgi:hypothetical protein